MTHLFYFYFVLFLLTFPLLRHFFICAHMYWITSLRNRTGEERRMWALCDKCDNNFVKITVAKVHFHLNRSFCKQPGNINVKWKSWQNIQLIALSPLSPQGPHSHILMTGGGGSDRGSYFIPQKIPTSEFVYPKKSLLFLAYPKKFLSAFASANFIIYLLK